MQCPRESTQYGCPSKWRGWPIPMQEISPCLILEPLEDIVAAQWLRPTRLLGEFMDCGIPKRAAVHLSRRPIERSPEGELLQRLREFLPHGPDLCKGKRPEVLRTFLLRCRVHQSRTEPSCARTVVACSTSCWKGCFAAAVSLTSIPSPGTSLGSQ